MESENIKRIDLAEWEAFGGGGIGTSYYNKTDDGVILKLNKASFALDDAKKEFRRSQGVAAMGLQTPKVLDVVTDGERYGLVVERIKKKVSYSRLIADHPERMDEYCRTLAEQTLELHATRFDAACFGEDVRDMAQLYDEAIQKCDHIPDDVKRRLKECVEMMEPAETCLHGDLHFGNMVESEGKNYWIDLGAFCKGDKYMDLGNMKLLGDCFPPQFVKEVFHFSARRFRKAFGCFQKHYFGERWNDPEVERKIEAAALLRAGVCVVYSPKAGKLFFPLIRGEKAKFAIIKFLSRFTKVSV